MNEKILSCSNHPVLILGETGTGKSFMAKKIHLGSKNIDHRFLQLNITSLNKNLFESEIFGHVRGAFSGALNDKKGFCEEVKGGTLFLDEIGDLSLELQAKLLTLIDERSYFQVGSCIKKNFSGKLIFATNKNLKEMVAKGEFREDLFYRLRFFSLELQPMRNRDDLFDTIMNEINSMKIKFNGQRTTFSVEALNKLVSYSWPGNYRELKNSIEYLFLLGKTRVETFDLPEWIIKGENREARVDYESSYQKALETFEVDFFQNQLKKNAGKINLTAQVSGISKVTLISKLKKYGIDRRIYKNLNKVDQANGF